MNQCQVLLDNKSQCTNPVWATNEGVDYCRLHFSYMLAKRADTLANPKAVKEEDQGNVDAMVALHFAPADKRKEELSQSKNRHEE